MKNSQNTLSNRNTVKTMKTLFTSLCVTILATVGLAQAPGGVSSGLVVWLKPDATGIAPVADGTAIASWNDASGLGNDAQQTTASARPQYYSNVFNGHPAIRTSSTRFFNIDFSGINNSNYTIITVSLRSTSIGSVVGFNGATSSTGLALGYAGSTVARHSQYANWVNMSIPANSPSTELPAILACQFNQSVGKKLWRINDGTNTSRSGTNTTSYVLSGSGRIGRGMANDGFGGSIAEVIVYNRVLTTLELQQLNTYLSVKYGLSVPMADHLYPIDATHQNDVFGIGYQTSYALNQTTSESAGMDDILQISNPSSINNGDYLICGNDNDLVQFSAHTGSNCTMNARLDRDWKFRHVGDFGTVALRFDLTGVTGFNASELRVVVDLDNDGYDDELPIQGTYSAPYFTATGVTIPNGAKATLCTVKSDYYAVVSGLSSGAIWSDSPTGTPGFLNATCSEMNLIIKSGVTINNDWSTLLCNNITVESGAVFNSGASASQNLRINGNITVNGVWNQGLSTLNMIGSAAQQVNGTGYLKVQNCNITNTAGVSLNGLGVLVYGNLGITSGGVLNTNGKLTLWSDISATGEIQSLNTGTINGEVLVKRYRASAVQGWVNLSSPFQNATIEDWDSGNLVTSGFPGSDAPSFPFNSFLHYDETLTGGVDNGHVGATNSSNPLVPGVGYRSWYGNGARTIQARGTINNGNVNLPVTYTNNGNASADGWNLVGNPYPATIDWTAEDWVKTNMADAVYVWRSNINQYAAFVNGVATNGGSPLIASGQSFFVQASGANPVLTVKEDCKSKDRGTFRSADAPREYMSLRMHMGDWQDETVLMAHESATKSFDDAFDAKKLRSLVAEAPYLATIDDNGQNLSINSIRMMGEEQIIPIRIEAGVTGVYTLEVSGLEAFTKGACVTLEEIFTHTSYVLAEGESIELPLEAGDHTLRYQLRIGAAALSNVTGAGCSSNKGGSAEVVLPVNSTSVVEWMNDQGQMFATTAPVDGIAKVESLVAGSYTARITNNGACGTTSFDFEVLQLNKLGASAAVIPSSCENTDDGGISISISGGEAPYNVAWNNGAEGSSIDNATAGEYVAHITDSNGCEGTFQFEVQSVSKLLSKFEVSHEQVELVNGEAKVDFTNVSENADVYDWNFGDGSEQSSDEHPTHSYLSAGNYEVMLKATYFNCEAVSTRTVAVTDNSQAEEFAGDVLATLTDRGVQVTFLFDEMKNIRINAYNVLGQQLIEPIVGEFGSQTILFSDRRYAANALIEVTDLNSGEKALIRLGR